MRLLGALVLAPGLCLADCAEDAMLVLDASASMAAQSREPGRTSRMDEARAALARVLPEVAPLRRMGLVIYGPGPAWGCDGVRLHLAPTPDAAAPILNRAARAEPEGRTALTRAVSEAAGVLGARGTVALVTDGEETCGGRPCALAGRLAETDVTVHVVGFRMREAHPPPGHLRGGPGANARPAGTDCLAEATGGLTARADTVAELAAALRRMLGCDLLF